MRGSERKVLAALLAMAVVALGCPHASEADIQSEPAWNYRGPGQIVFGDFDGNGYEDIASAGSRITLHLFDAKGRWRQEVPASDPFDERGFVLAAADLDDDSFCDLVVANTRSGIEVFSGGVTGLEHLRNRPLLLPTTKPVRAVTTVDVDGDGYLDLVLATAGPNLLIRGSSAGFEDPRLAFNDFGVQPSRAILVFDADGNGTQDVLIGNDGSNELYLARPNGEFREGSRSALNTGFASTPEFFEADDVNDDGLLDVIAGTRSVFLGTGGGLFSVTAALAQPYYEAPSVPAPTLSGAGLFLAALLLLTITIIQLRQRSE